MAELTNDIRYLQLKEQFWQNHYDLSLKEGIWGMESSRSFAKQHRVCRTYSFKKHVIEEGQMTTKIQMNRTIEALQICLLQLEVHARQWQPSIDYDILSYAIDEFVQRGQR